MKPVFRMMGPQGFGSYWVEFGPEGLVQEKVDTASQRLLVPGFVDIHIHGAFGIDFMSASLDDMAVLSSKLRQVGYECYLPTTVTASADAVTAALMNLPASEISPGFHLEGPFISPKYPGAQPPSAIVEFPEGPSPWDSILQDARLKVITLAPEQPRALEAIRSLASRGVLVSMGHTAATYDEARFGFEFGASHTTHTYNAMRGLHHREAGTVGYALMQDGLSCEVIYDRLHVCKQAMELLLKSKPASKVIAVSDSTLVTGMPPGTRTTMWGLEVETGKNKVTLAGTDTLAGSAVTLLDVFRNLVEDFGEEVAITLCSINPRLALGITEKPRVYCEFDAELNLVEVYARPQHE